MQSIQEVRFEKLQATRDAYVVKRNELCMERSSGWSDAGFVSQYKYPKEITDIEKKIKEIDLIVPLLRPRLW